MRETPARCTIGPLCEGGLLLPLPAGWPATVMRLLGLALSLVLFAAPARAQEAVPFVPGYLVTAEGDTLRGEAQELIDLAAAREVVFRAGPDAPVQTYTPATALAYGDAAGRRYVARAVQAEFEGPEAGYFLQVLVDGRLDLLRLAVGPDDDRFFVQDEGGEPVGLYVTRDRRYETQRAESNTQGGLYDEVNPRYRPTLARAFYGCPEMQAEAADLKLRQRDLVRAVVAFTECVGRRRPSPTPRADATTSPGA